jgi:hypothetical protein
MCRMLTTAVALLLAFVTEARKYKFPDYSPPKTPPYKKGYYTTTSTYSSSVKCKAKATTFNFQSSQDAHVAAGEQSLRRGNNWSSIRVVVCMHIHTCALWKKCMRQTL